MHAESHDRLSLFRLAIFSSPMIVVTVIEIAWRVYLPSFFAGSIGLSLATAGLLLLAARLFDSAIDPVIAWASDRFSTRFGHRRPWLVASLLPILLGTAGTFFLWPWTSLATIAASAMLLHLGFMMLATPHGGWALELARRPADGLRVMATKNWFAVVGMIAVLLLLAGLERGFDVGRQGQVAAIGLALLLVAPVIILLVVRCVPEPVLPRTRAAELANPLRLFADIVREPALRPILMLYLLAGLAESAGSAVFLFFVEGTLRLDGWGSTLLLVQYGLALVTLPLWSKVGGRIGPRQLLMIVYGWQIAVVPIALLLPAGMLWPVIGFVLLRSLFAGVEFTVLRAMVADVAGRAAATGLRHGASCYSVSNITLKIAMGVGAWLALVLVDLSAEGEQGPAVRLVYALVPPMVSAIGLLIVGGGWRRGPAVRAIWQPAVRQSA